MGPQERQVLEMLRVAKQLRNRMQVFDGFEETGDLTEFRVRTDLLQVRLGQAQFVLLISSIGSREDLLYSPPDPLVTQLRLSISSHLLSDSDGVFPGRFLLAVCEFDFDLDIRFTARRYLTFDRPPR